MKYLAVLLVGLFALGGLILLNTIYPVFPRVANTTRDFGKNIVENWRGFLSGKKDEMPEPASPVLNSNEISDLIKSEVDKAVAARLAEMAGASGGPTSGLVVVPAGQRAPNTTSDIAKSFSDEVDVYPDSSGQSGVIVPVFTDGPGESYLYVLTPIKQ